MGHYQKDYSKRRAWFEKKDKHLAFVCFESNLTKVSSNTCWIDSGATVHVSNTTQGFMFQTIKPNEKVIFMENRVKALVEIIGTFRLFLETGNHLDLFQILYIPSISCNLV